MPSPKHFRYGWGRSPLANLQAVDNKDLPFATQRSDGWAMGEVPLDVLGAGVDGSGALTRAQWNRILETLKQEDARRRVAEAKETLRQFEEAAQRETTSPDKKPK